MEKKSDDATGKACCLGLYLQHFEKEYEGYYPRGEHESGCYHVDQHLGKIFSVEVCKSRIKLSLKIRACRAFSVDRLYKNGGVEVNYREMICYAADNSEDAGGDTHAERPLGSDSGEDNERARDKSNDDRRGEGRGYVLFAQRSLNKFKDILKLVHNNLLIKYYLYVNYSTIFFKSQAFMSISLKKSKKFFKISY